MLATQPACQVTEQLTSGRKIHLLKELRQLGRSGCWTVAPPDVRLSSRQVPKKGARRMGGSRHLKGATGDCQHGGRESERRPRRIGCGGVSAFAPAAQRTFPDPNLRIAWQKGFKTGHNPSTEMMVRRIAQPIGDRGYDVMDLFF